MSLACGPSGAEVSVKLKGALGGQLSGGEVHSGQVRADLFYNYNKLWDHEWTAKARSAFESSEGEDLISKHFAALRYGRSITRSLYWFSSADFEKDHERDLNARYGFVLGVGHWFADDEDFRLSVETSAGRYADHMLDRTIEDYNVLQLTEKFSRGFFGTLRLNQGVFLTSLKDGYRYILDASIEHIINESWGFATSLDYDIAVHDDGSHQEDIALLMKLQFNYEAAYTE